MKRLQPYIDEPLWAMLERRAARDGIGLSESVRRILVQKLESDFEARENAMLGIIGLWKDRDDLPDTDTSAGHAHQSSHGSPNLD